LLPSEDAALQLHRGERNGVTDSRRKKLASAVLAAGMTLGVMGSALAETDPELIERLKVLESEVALLKRQLEVKQEADDNKSKSSAIASAGPDGFSLQSPDKKFQIKLRGYIQTDGRFFEEGEQTDGVDTFVMRRVRPIVEGTVGEYVDFKIMPDFGQGQATLFDAYANLHYWSFAQLQGGKFKPPVGLERLQGATSLLFVERAFPTQLVPNRDIGFQLGGDIGSGLFSYQVGAFNGVRDNGNDLDTDTNDGKDVDARIFAHPFQNTSWEFLQGLGAGVAMTWGDQNQSTPLPTYRTAMQSTFFTYNPAKAGTVPAGGVSVRGIRWRIAPQGYYYWGPFGLLWEYTANDTALKRQTRTLDATNEAWQVAASWVLTGENASFRGVIPRSPFTPAFSGFGAFEIAARYTAMNLDDAIFPFFANPNTSARRATEWSVGLNWYMNRWVKLVLNYERTSFAGGALDGKDRTDEGGVLTRLQLSY
jgi:phosphate-selective porin OprO/OprP